MKTKKKTTKPRAQVPFNTGSRIHKSKKGKGSYSRKERVNEKLNAIEDCVVRFAEELAELLAESKQLLKKETETDVTLIRVGDLKQGK